MEVRQGGQCEARAQSRWPSRPDAAENPAKQIMSRLDYLGDPDYSGASSSGSAPGCLCRDQLFSLSFLPGLSCLSPAPDQPERQRRLQTLCAVWWHHLAIRQCLVLIKGVSFRVSETADFSGHLSLSSFGQIASVKGFKEKVPQWQQRRMLQVDCLERYFNYLPWMLLQTITNN